MKVAVAGLIVAASLVGCGKAAFIAVGSSQDQSAPGNFTVPPKVDLLLVEDDTGSIVQAYPTISQQMPQFLTQLQSEGWDYHFATIPLTTDQPLTQATASQYDGNWGSQWQPPYPGAQQNGPGTLLSSIFKLPSDYQGFVNSVNTQIAGMEPGFENISLALQTRLPGTNFLRPDALLVVLVVGNGNDTSNYNLCNQGDGKYVPCEQTGYYTAANGNGSTWNNTAVECGTPGTFWQNCENESMSFGQYASQFLAVKANPSLIQFHAAVAAEATNNCLGSYSLVGTRYQQMAGALGGQSYDICTQSVSQVLDSLSNNLHGTRLSFRTRYLFISQAPNVSTITVTKYPGGNTGQAQTIPQDPNNGWTYDGYLSNVYAIDSPTPMDQGSGYAIELHGSAKLVGDDTANVAYTPAGVQSSSK